MKLKMWKSEQSSLWESTFTIHGPPSSICLSSLAWIDFKAALHNSKIVKRKTFPLTFPHFRSDKNVCRRLWWNFHKCKCKCIPGPGCAKVGLLWCSMHNKHDSSVTSLCNRDYSHLNSNTNFGITLQPATYWIYKFTDNTTHKR